MTKDSKEELHAEIERLRRRVGELEDICAGQDRESLWLTRHSLDHAAYPVYWIAPDKTIVYANLEGARLLGMAADKLVGRRLDEFDRELDDAFWQRAWRHIEADGTLSSERTLTDAGGRRFPALVVASLVSYGDDRFQLAFVRDISEQKDYEKSLQRSEERLRTVFDAVYDAIFIHSIEGEIIDVNEKMLELYKVERDEALTLSIAEDYSAPNAPTHRLPDIWQRVVNAQPQFFEWQARRPGDGSLFEAEVFLRRLDMAGRDVIMANVRDVSSRKQAEREIRLLAGVFENTIEGITVTDPQGTILAVNPAFTEITGYSREEALGQNPRILKSERHDDLFYRDMWQSLIENGSWEGEIWNRRKNGEAYPEWLSISAVNDDQGRLQNYVAVFHDITEVKRNEERIRHLAYHDALTGLPNRALLIDRLETAAAHAKRAGHRLAVIFLDLDNFKHINDSLGHVRGDELLRQTAERLAKTVRQEDTVARLGGDEFVIMVQDISHISDAAQAAQRIQGAFAERFYIDGNEFFINASLGVSIYPEDGDDPQKLIKNADLAMYRAKEEGKNSYQLYTPALNARALERLELERDMHKALENDEFTVYFQPRIDLNTMTVRGMEALARWKRPDGSVTGPGEFIPLAEETGLIDELGEVIMTKACRAADHWHRNGHPQLGLSVNLSPRQFLRRDMVPRIASLIERTGFAPERLELEVTETALMQDTARAVRLLGELTELGCSIAIDDFGTGYSSLYYLKHFPINALKIDRSFIRDIPRDPSDIAITTAIISMCKSLELAVVAEGVETAVQLNFLLGLRCDECQGYYFSPPVDRDAFSALLERGRFDLGNQPDG